MNNLYTVTEISKQIKTPPSRVLSAIMALCISPDDYFSRKGAPVGLYGKDAVKKIKSRIDRLTKQYGS